MELSVFSREAKTKGETKQLRRTKNIPAVLYAAGEKNENVYLKAEDFNAILRKIQKGRLSTTILKLKKDKKTFDALVKDIHYHPTSYEILHLDFQLLAKDLPVKVNVPIEFVGIADCVGIKLGGSLRKVIRKCRVLCKPKDIPSRFILDVTHMKINDSKRLSEMEIPKEVKALTPLNEVAVVIAKR